jgi:hypothetical protein
MSTESTTPIGPTPPYLPFRTFKGFIDGFRESGLPGQIDRSVMSRKSGADQAGLMQAFKFLKLIDADGKPTQGLVDLTKAGSDVKKAYADLVSKHYAFVSEKGLKLSTATDKQLDDIFGTKGVSGGTIQKAVTFFVQMATEAGLEVSPFLKSAKRKAPSGGGGGSRRIRKKAAAPNGASQDPAEGAQSAAPAGHKTYVLDLNADGTRFIRMTAPWNLNSLEVERIKGWMGFQFNVEAKKG